jgi:hypothetical protein
MTVVALWAAVVRYVWRAWRSDRNGCSAGRSRIRSGSISPINRTWSDPHEAAAADLPNSVR